MVRRITVHSAGEDGVAGTVTRMGWAERVADRSPAVQRSKGKSVEQARSIVSAARRLIDAEGPTFTTQELIKEAGIALQTFYRYFSGKDALLLAVIEDLIEETCLTYRAHAETIADPVERLRFYVTTTVQGLSVAGWGPSFITAEHFRLQTQYPAEVSLATQPYTDLLIDEIDAAMSAGQLPRQDAKYSAWLITQLVMAVFHHYDCAGVEETTDVIGQRLWGFCFAALEGSKDKG